MQIRDPVAGFAIRTDMDGSEGWSQHEWTHRKRQNLGLPVPLEEMDCWDFEIRHYLLKGKNHAVGKGIRLEFSQEN